jgi:UDP-N-acetylmuramoyl-tripeptide--D-alanyl-D-alanine ligase
MARLSVDEIATATGGRVSCGAGSAQAEGAAIDSRAVQGGEVFFAFAGERTDGHRFVADALARGAAAAVVEEPVARPERGAVIEVHDTFTALHDLARHVRSRVPEKLVGITGSAGKTTTKDLLAAVLAARFRVAWTRGNLNNLYGFPLSLLNVPDGTQWMVAEMGMSTPGELRQLSLLGRPDVALFTVVRPAHLEFFGSVAAIAEAKAELLAGLRPEGVIVANADDLEVSRIVRRHAAQAPVRVVWYGIENPAEVRASAIRPAPEGEVGSRFELRAGEETQEVTLPLHGRYNVENCLAAAACGWALGVSLAEIASAVGTVRPAAHRGVVHRARRGFTLVDDSYNSNPDALGKALAGAAQLGGRRRVAILGAMLELGPEGPRFHREAGELAARLGFTPIVGVGEAARDLVAGAASAGAVGLWLSDAAAAVEWAEREIADSDLVLVKGSRGVGLERVVERLLGERSSASAGAGAEAH